jgi:uncharacterized membrane protein required for colicin V production
MLIDLLIAIALATSAYFGFRNGFMKTLFGTIGYISGGLLGLYLSLNYTHTWSLDYKRVGLVIAAIAIGGYIGSFAGHAVARGFRATLIRGPLGFIDNLLGAIVEVVRTVIVVYLIASVLLWSPWQSAKSAISESTIYAKIDAKLPGVLTQVKEQIKAEFLNLRL